MLKIISVIILQLPLLCEAQDLVYKPSEIKSLHVRNSTGDVNVAPALDGLTKLTFNKTKWGQRCKLKTENNKGHVFISVDDENWVLDHECRIDIVVAVSKELPLRLSSGSGDIHVVGTRGDLDVKLGSGELMIKADIKSINALSGSGNVSILGSTEKATVKAGSGNVSLDLNEVAKSAQLSVQVGSGDVEILLPDNSLVASETATGGGYVRNDFKNNPDAALKINAKSGTGDILIRKK